MLVFHRYSSFGRLYSPPPPSFLCLCSFAYIWNHWFGQSICTLKRYWKHKQFYFSKMKVLYYWSYNKADIVQQKFPLRQFSAFPPLTRLPIWGSDHTCYQKRCLGQRFVGHKCEHTLFSTTRTRIWARCRCPCTNLVETLYTSKNVFSLFGGNPLL